MSSADFVQGSQKGLKQILREKLKQLQIHPDTKAILTTDQNWSLAAKIMAEFEDEIDQSFVKPGRDWITELKERAYITGNKYTERLVMGGNPSDAVILRGLDGTTLKLIKQQAYDQIRKIAAGQADYIRTTLLDSVINNASWPETMDRMIHDGKIPSLRTVDKNGVARFIEMETRIETIVRTETSRIAEQGSKDKAREYFGEQMLGRWHTTIDGNERASHRARNGMVRSLEEWENVPGPDGKVLLPGQEPNCRCWMEWGDEETFARRDAGEEQAA